MLSYLATFELQLVIDHHPCIESLAKYAAKRGNISSVAGNAFAAIAKLTNLITDPEAKRKLFVKCVGDNDLGTQEVFYDIISLKLQISSFNVITVSPNGSR